MAQRFYPLSLDLSSFPMLSEQQTRTVIGTTTDANMPGIAYCHNVMPSKYGLDAIGYNTEVIALNLSSNNPFISIDLIYSETRQRTYLGRTLLGDVYALDPDVGSSAWTLVGNPGHTTEVSLGTVDGVTYIMYSTLQIYTYNSLLVSLTEITTTGLDIPKVLGIAGSSGHLIAYTATDIAWSSTLVPYDFTPSSATGAGGGSVSGISGSINFASSNSLGLLIYTDDNVVAATYTGNAKYPFKFKVVENSKGAYNTKYVSKNTNTSYQYAYTKSGMQLVDSQASQIILPEVTDFLAGLRFEEYNETTKQLEIITLSDTDVMDISVNFLASRYLLVSYGVRTTDAPVYTMAMVFDVVLQRLGKLKIDHVDTVDYYSTQLNIAKESLAFLTTSGELKLLNFETDANADGLVIIGKFQATYSRLLNLLGVEVENIPSNFPLAIYDKASYDGKTTTNVDSTGIREDENNIREYLFRATAKNHSLTLQGAFNLVTLLVRYSIAGRR